MSDKLETNRGWRIARRILIALAVLATLIAVFYTEEDWRGKHDWEKCKAQMEAKGIAMDWSKYIPPAIPDNENIFKAPKMQEWFVKGMVQTNGVTWFHGPNELTQKLQGTNGYLTTSVGSTNNLISTPEIAQKYLAWSGQVFQPDFNLIREALKRPSARMDGDYSLPELVPLPNFVAVRTVAQVSAQRAHCYILLNQPDRALDELTLIHDLRGLMQPPPSGKPETLVAAMINVAVMGLYASEVEEGFQKNVWQEPQLVALQKQTADTDVVPWVLNAMRTEPATTSIWIERTPLFKIFNLGIGTKPNWGWKEKTVSYLFPRGWIYQNMVSVMSTEGKPLSGFDTESGIFHPKIFDLALSDTEKFLAHKTPYNVIASIGIPNFEKAWQVTAHNQTMVNEAQIACALECYHITNGNYPETLDALAPQFIEKIPHDIIGGGQLIYRRTNDQPSQSSGLASGKFLLYSVGWNETDDGGVDSSDIKNASSQFAEGDWVWKN